MTVPKPNILHIIDTTGPGGAETIFTQLASATQQEGWKTLALIRGPGWVMDELQRLGIRYHIEDCKGSVNLTFLRKLVRIVRREKIDIIQSHLLGSNLYACLAGLITRTPVISTFHGFVDISPDERLRFFKFLIISLGSKKIIAVTNQLADALRDIAGVKGSKVGVIPNGIDIQRFSSSASIDLKKTLGIQQEATLIGCLGNVREAKNYDLAILTLQKLRGRGIDAKLVIAGDDKNELAEQHRHFATTLRMENHVFWLGFFKETPGFLKSIDVFLLSSSSEGHPLAITQAMAAGKPIVATRCGIEEILTHQQNALLAPKDSAEDLATHIQALVNDHTLCKELSQRAARDAQQNFSLDAMYGQYFSLYTDAPLRERGSMNIMKVFHDYYGGKRGALTLYYYRLQSLLSGKYSRYDITPDNINRLVFVCKGNICRSALAEQYFRSISPLPTASIGLQTQTGKPAYEKIACEAQRLGVDMSSHRTLSIEDFQPAAGDVYVCMEPEHIDMLEQRLGDQPYLLLGLFGNPKRIYLHDPYMAHDTYIQWCARFIIQSLDNLHQALEARRH